MKQHLHNYQIRRILLKLASTSTCMWVGFHLKFCSQPYSIDENTKYLTVIKLFKEYKIARINYKIALKKLRRPQPLLNSQRHYVV